MLNSLTRSATRVALGATFLIPFAGSTFAQSANDRSTAALEKEVTALRAKVHHLELEKEISGLHAKVDQLQGRRPAQAAATQSTQGAPQQLVTRIETTSPDRTLVMADMPMKAAPPPVPYYSWTGFYVGGNIGYGVGNDRVRPVFFQDPATNAGPFDTAVTPAGGIGGVQFGYNWQGGPNWLVGFEADFQGSAQKAISCVIICTNSPGANATVETLTVAHNIDYFSTVRGRFGFVDRGNLFYVTGGGAYGHVNQQVSFFQNLTGPPASFFSGSVSSTENKFGWVVGAGVESSLGGNLTAKVEYLYMDLGSIGTALNGVLPAQGFFLPQAITLSANGKLHDNIIRAGLNYRFGPPAAPAGAYDAMAAVPPPIYAWTGFYVGVNAGYGFGNDHNQIDLAAPGATSTSEPGVSVTPRGGLGGVQVGYNWQASPHWLAGFEADLQGTAQNDTVCASVACISQTGTPQGQFTESFAVQHQLDYFGTLRGRLGYVHNNTLFYGTGGLAFGHIRETIHINITGQTPIDQGSTKDLTGYVVGGGIEASLWGGWSAKGEYLYMNLGSLSQTIDLGSLQTGASLTSNSTVRDHIVRFGLNYHIGAAPY